MSNTLAFITTYVFSYNDSNLLWSISGASRTNKEEFYMAASINPKQSDDLNIMRNSIMELDDEKKATLVVDYRLLENENVRDILKESYKKGKIYGVRAIPEGATLDKKTYDMYNTKDFKDFIFAIDRLHSDIDLTSSKLNVLRQDNLFTAEKCKYSIIEGDLLITREELNAHITKELSDNDLTKLAKILNKGRYGNIYFDFYEPSYYAKAIYILKKARLNNEIFFNFIANPLYDVTACYNVLPKLCENGIEIHYNTCTDLNEAHKLQPHSALTNYYSDLESCGYCQIKPYIEMLTAIDEIVEHMNSKQYSPLERVCYVEDYFKNKLRYDKNYGLVPNGINPDLHRVFNTESDIPDNISDFVSCILRRAGVSCLSYGDSIHERNILRIKDRKYNLDHVAIIDIASDIEETYEYNENEPMANPFKHFLNPMLNYLMNPEGEIISAPTSLLLEQEFYDKYVEESNPIRETMPLGYGFRMLDLMGYGVPQEKQFPNIEYEEYVKFVKNCVMNDIAGKIIEPSSIIDAIVYVRKQEGKYQTIDERLDDSIETSELIARRDFNDNGVFEFKIAFNNPEKAPILADVYEETSKFDHFMDIPTINLDLMRPRDKFVFEINKDYYSYLHKYYCNKFMNRNEFLSDAVLDDELLEKELAKQTEEETKATRVSLNRPERRIINGMVTPEQVVQTEKIKINLPEYQPNYTFDESFQQFLEDVMITDDIYDDIDDTKDDDRRMRIAIDIQELLTESNNRINLMDSTYRISREQMIQTNIQQEEKFNFVDEL